MPKVKRGLPIGFGMVTTVALDRVAVIYLIQKSVDLTIISIQVRKHDGDVYGLYLKNSDEKYSVPPNVVVLFGFL